jgi:hypothetical protein
MITSSVHRVFQVAPHPHPFHLRQIHIMRIKSNAFSCSSIKSIAIPYRVQILYVFVGCFILRLTFAFMVLDEANRIDSPVMLCGIFPHVSFIKVTQMLIKHKSRNFALTAQMRVSCLHLVPRSRIFTQNSLRGCDINCAPRSIPVCALPHESSNRDP